MVKYGVIACRAVTQAGDTGSQGTASGDLAEAAGPSAAPSQELDAVDIEDTELRAKRIPWAGRGWMSSRPRAMAWEQTEHKHARTDALPTGKSRLADSLSNAIDYVPKGHESQGELFSRCLWNWTSPVTIPHGPIGSAGCLLLGCCYEVPCPSSSCPLLEKGKGMCDGGARCRDCPEAAHGAWTCPSGTRRAARGGAGPPRGPSAQRRHTRKLSTEGLPCPAPSRVAASSF